MIRINLLATMEDKFTKQEAYAIILGNIKKVVSLRQDEEYKREKKWREVKGY